jgi:hypothetical protein
MSKKTAVSKATLLYTENKEIPANLKVAPEFESLSTTPQEFQELYAKADAERIEQTERAANTVCEKYVPKLYNILREHGYSIGLSRKIVIHFTVNRGWWKLGTVRDHFPNEAKNKVKQYAANKSVAVRRENKEAKIQKLETKTIDETAEELAKKHGLANLPLAKRRAIAKEGYEARKQVEPQMESTNGKLSAAQRWGTILLVIHKEEHHQLEKAYEDSLSQYGTGTYVIRLHNGEFVRAEPKQDSELESKNRAIK